MKTVAIFLTLLAAVSPCGAQLPGPAGNTSGRPSQKDIHVYRFSREFAEQKFDFNDVEMPDELRVTTTDKIHIVGKKREQKTQRVKGRLTGHIGKLALVTVGERTGKVMVKIPPAQDVTYYFASLELTDDTLQTKIIELDAKKIYAWSVHSQNGQTTFRIVDGATEVMQLAAPSDKVKGFGFAATVRNSGNEADLSMTFD
jgi:hypothetical protein